MFDYDAERLRDVILQLTRSNISPEATLWFSGKLDISETSAINAAFSLIPRKTGVSVIKLRSFDRESISTIKPGLSVEGWTADRLCRVCLLLHLDAPDKDTYFKTIEALFLAAEMNELVALYSALPLLAYPDIWRMRCAEGIRSNIGGVLEAIMHHNPYPAKHLDEKAWNQLVLKAFFTDKDVNKIYGLDERANAELALILSDYAHERWAAGRKVNPLLWRLTTNYIDGRILDDLKRVFREGDMPERQAAALAVHGSSSKDAKELLDDHKDLSADIKRGKLKWESLGEG
ncbi:MAG: EboA domain-containing protein [Daejeonella sp.]